MPPDAAFVREEVRRMRLASWLEGTTLVALVCVAVPLKHLAGYPAATSVMGPVHGLAFLLYIWMLSRTVASCGWTKGEILRLLAAAVVPFGALANARVLKRKQDTLARAA